MATLEALSSVLLKLATASLAVLAISFLLNEFIRHRARNPLFNGPRGRPIFGNLLDLNVNAPEKLRQWSKTYGDVYQVQFGNRAILVVNSAAAAKELFSHQGHALNSRPIMYTFHKVVGKTCGYTIGTSPMTPDLKRQRRAAASALNRPATASYAPLLHLETNLLMKDILSASRMGTKQINPMALVKRFALSIILTINWGRSITADDRALFDEITQVEDGISASRQTTENLQDWIPLLRLNPFSARTKRADDWSHRRMAYLGKLDSELRTRIEKGTHKPCIQANAFLDEDATLSPQDLQTITTSVLQGGTGTISGTISWTIMYLSQHPEIQEKAYQELKAAFPNILDVLDQEVAETVDTAEKLPHIFALAQECLRYFTVLRLSLPRETTKDCTYEGKRIPAGSMIFLNAWACNMDSAVWKDPEEFRPERWIEQPNAPLFTYGLGYRMCAGSALANRELELVLMKMLACFEILPGEGKRPDASPWTGSANLKESGRSPKAYEVLFRVRDEKGVEAKIGLVGGKGFEARAEDTAD